MTTRHLSPSTAGSGRTGLDHVDWLATEPIGVLCVGLDGDPPAVPEQLAGVDAEPPVDVHTAPTAEAALETLSGSGSRIACVVSEYDLGVATGIDLLEAVRDTDRNLPFVMVTADDDERVASRAISAGITDYLRRTGTPEQAERLVERIADAVARYRTERAAHRAFLGMETAREGMSLLDADGRFTYVNQVYADNYGYDREAMVGMHWSELYPEDEADAEIEEILPDLEERGSWTGETAGLGADGPTFPEEHSRGSATSTPRRGRSHPTSGPAARSATSTR